jgi:hypothetical protein
MEEVNGSNPFRSTKTPHRLTGFLRAKVFDHGSETKQIFQPECEPLPIGSQRETDYTDGQWVGVRHETIDTATGSPVEIRWEEIDS